MTDPVSSNCADIGVQGQQPLELRKQVESVMLRVRAAFAGILESVPTRNGRPHEVAELLNLDKQLVWKISRLVKTRDPVMMARHLPGPTAIGRFLDAAQLHVAPRVIDAIHAPLEDLNELIRVHAGDRVTFEMLLSEWYSREPDATVTHRREAFRGNSCIWGVQARTKLTSMFLHPSSEDGVFDIAIIAGVVDLRRLRLNLPWVIARWAVSDNDGEVRFNADREPLDPESNDPLLRRFCSKPLPQLRIVNGAPGMLEYQLAPGAIGNSGAVTCIYGNIVRRVASCYRDEHNEFNEVMAAMSTPCEVLVLDQIVHESLFGRIKPDLLVYSGLNASEQYPRGVTRVQLPVAEQVEYLGKGPAVLPTPHVPRYRELAEYVFERTGWDGSRFDVYRAEMRYPPIPSTVVMQHALRERPAGR